MELEVFQTFHISMGRSEIGKVWSGPGADHGVPAPTEQKGYTDEQP